MTQSILTVFGVRTKALWTDGQTDIDSHGDAVDLNILTISRLFASDAIFQPLGGPFVYSGLERVFLIKRR